MGNEIAPGKRVLIRLGERDEQLTPGIVETAEDGIITVVAGGRTVTRFQSEVKLGTQDTDPAAWMLHDGRTSKRHVEIRPGCYICEDPEFEQMGLPLCRACPECRRQGRGDGHIAADDTTCDDCGYEDGPEDYMDKTQIIADALRLARERVTGDDVRWKRERKQELDGLYNAVALGLGTRPTAAGLREALGDPDNRELRWALDEWDKPTGMHAMGEFDPATGRSSQDDWK